MRQLHFNFTFIRFLLAFLCIGDAKAVLISLLLDATDKLTGLQPVKNGPGYPTGWQPLDNDTHGDPGNILRNFQIDYAAALMAIGDDVSVLREPSVVGLIKFKTLQPV